MRLPEHVAKDIFAQYGVPTMPSCLFSSADFICGADRVREKIQKAGIKFPAVLKAQVPIGGRGKSGGIRFVDNLEQMIEESESLLKGKIGGYQIDDVLLVEKAIYRDEWYLSIMLNRENKSPMLIFSTAGGIDIEENARLHPEKIIRSAINPLRDLEDYTIRYIVSTAGLPMSYVDSLSRLIKKIYAIFLGYSSLLVEINPLVVTENGELIALDAKMEVDESSVDRFPILSEYRDKMTENPLIKEARRFNFLYIPIEDDGRIAVISNGSGMLMSCIDMISKGDMKVGSALDLGGGATAERISEAVSITLSNNRINTVLINIFGGITRCDEVAAGLLKALENDITTNKRIVVRLEGTNKDIGKSILSGSGDRIILAENLIEAVAALRRLAE